MNRVFLPCLGLLAGLAACTPQNPTTMVSTTPGPDELNVADAAIAGGDPGMALSVSQSILKDNPTDVDALVHEGDAYYALGRCPDSQAAYQLALAQDPKSSAAETGLGRCLIKTDPAAAEAALTLAVQDDPGNANALNDLGIARDLQGNFAGAIDPYKRALLAKPGNVAAEINLGLSLALSGNGQAALQYLGPLATGPGATAKTREDYAAGLVAIGRIDQARLVLGVDLPPPQVDAAIEGFEAVIAASQPPLPDSAAPPPPPPTTPQVATPPVQSASIEPQPLTPSTPAAASAAPMTPAAAPPVPDITAPPQDNAPQDPDAAYTGPSPVPGAISSSTGGPGAAAAETPPPAPARQMAAAAPPAPAQPAPADTATAGAYMVQLGALDSQPAAQHQWDRISGAMPALFSDKQPDIVAATVNGHVYYRLRTGSFDSKADAAKFCGEVSAAGNACTLADF